MIKLDSTYTEAYSHFLGGTEPTPKIADQAYTSATIFLAIAGMAKGMNLSEDAVSRISSYAMMGRDFEYADNFRFALAGDATSVASYEETRSRGCCGFSDEVFFDDAGDTFLVGCNYGH